MALDFSRVGSRLAKANQKGGYEKKDYSKIYFKPTIGKQKIRIIPWKGDITYPFIEVQFHKYDTFKKYIPTLANYGEKDPILKFREKVFKDLTSTEEDKEFMKTLSPKTSIFVQVIVRGKEELGPLLWDVNITNFKAIAAIMENGDEYGDITDIANGRDLIVEGYNTVNPKSNKTYMACNITVSVKQTPLSMDAEKAEKWLTDQLVPLEQYKKFTSEEISTLLENYLNPADEDEENTEQVAPAKVAPKAPAKAPTQKFVKLEELEVDPELEETITIGEEDEPVVKVATKPKSKVKPAVVVEEDVDPELMEEDELSHVIPKTAPAPKAAAKTKPAPAAKAKPLSIASKFDALYGDDEEED